MKVEPIFERLNIVEELVRFVEEFLFLNIVERRYLLEFDVEGSFEDYLGILIWDEGAGFRITGTGLVDGLLELVDSFGGSSS